MKRSKSSRRWLNEHVTDPYVQAAAAEGYRSRAVYKLLEINEKDKIIRPGMVLIDLGSAPGGWSQIAQKIMGSSGRIIALDILPMDPLTDVEFIQGDFTNDEVFQILLKTMAQQKVDLVLSDMAPNISGNKQIDQPRSMFLAELCLDLAERVLKPGGNLLVKTFQGAEFDAFLQQLRRKFIIVVIRKPKASRSRSKEVYLLAKGYKL